jgi:hypothetical protein
MKSTTIYRVLAGVTFAAIFFVAGGVEQNTIPTGKGFIVIFTMLILWVVFSHLGKLMLNQVDEINESEDDK